MIHVVMLITNIDSDFEKSISISEGSEISVCNVHKGHVIIFSLFQMQILKTPNYYSGYTKFFIFVGVGTGKTTLLYLCNVVQC